MSTCISRSGEFSEHEFGGNAPEFTCRRCWVFDEDAALAEVASLRGSVERARAVYLAAVHKGLTVQPTALRDALDGAP